MKLTISKELEQRLSAIAENPIVQAILTRDNIPEDCINYLSISNQNPAYISYLTKDRLNRFPSEGDRWDPDKRYHGKSGAVLEKLFPGEFTSKEKQDFTSLFKIEGCKECETEKVEFFKGRDIAHYYNRENYIGYSDGDYYDRDDSEWMPDSYSGSSLWESCMRYTDCRSYFGIYTENPNIVSLAVLFKNGEVAARCICWTPKEYPKRKFFDRIYACNDYYWNMMFGCLTRDGWENISSKNNCNEYVASRLYFKLDKWRFDNYPYVDTMRNLLNGGVNNYGKGQTMEYTDGSISAEFACPCCGETYHEDDLYTISRGDYTGDLLCENCRVYSQYYEEYIAAENAVELYDGDFVLERDAVELYEGSYAFSGDSLLEEDVDGNSFIKRFIPYALHTK